MVGKGPIEEYSTEGMCLRGWGRKNKIGFYHKLGVRLVGKPNEWRITRTHMCLLLEHSSEQKENN